MCASGGTGSTGSSGGTGTSTTTGGSTTAGTASIGRTGTTSAAATAANAINLVQMARQFQQMQAQAEQAQALYLMQMAYLEGEMIRMEWQQIEDENAARLARAQKRRELQAVKAGQRKSRKSGARRETPVLRGAVSIAFQDQ
jgi:hypothetical protein